MNKIFITIWLLCLTAISFAQSKEAGSDREAIKQFMNNRDTMPNLIQGKNVDLIKKTLKRYNSAIESLDVTGTERFLQPIQKYMNLAAAKAAIVIFWSITSRLN